MADRVTMLEREEVTALLDGVDPWNDTNALESHHFLLSIAVSLKRIAEAMDGESPKGSVLFFLDTIASAANAGRR